MWSYWIEDYIGKHERLIRNDGESLDVWCLDGRQTPKKKHKKKEGYDKQVSVTMVPEKSFKRWIVFELD